MKDFNVPMMLVGIARLITSVERPLRRNSNNTPIVSSPPMTMFWFTR